MERRITLFYSDSSFRTSLITSAPDARPNDAVPADDDHLQRRIVVVVVVIIFAYRPFRFPARRGRLSE